MLTSALLCEFEKAFYYYGLTYTKCRLLQCVEKYLWSLGNAVGGRSGKAEKKTTGRGGYSGINKVNFKL